MSCEEAGDKDNWDPDSLLELSDIVRGSLNGATSMSIADEEVLLVILNSMLDRNQPSKQTELLKIIKYSRFERLLRSLLMSKDTLAYAPNNQIILITAIELEKKWKQLFKVSYLNLDADRSEDMKNVMALHDVTVKSKEETNDQSGNVKSVQFKAKQEGRHHFKPGE